jgi:DNA primase
VKQSPEQKKLLEQTALKYQQHVNLAEEYLAKRGLSLQDVERFKLGVVAEPIVGHEIYKGRLSIPYITEAGVVDIRFRSINGEEPKYLGIPGATTHLYSAGKEFAKDLARRLPGVIQINIPEGEDVNSLFASNQQHLLTEKIEVAA